MEQASRHRRFCSWCLAAAGLSAGMVPEVVPETGGLLGNVPLVWSHAEAARAFYLLGAAALKARDRSPGLWAWRLVRYLRLRWPRRDSTTEDDR